MSFLISIITPAYNAERFIAKAIESVIAQTDKNWELIIVDDGSIDNTAKIISSFALNDQRIKYYYQINKKQAAARNLGISYSTGEWIAFFDADDLWEPEKLETQRKFIENTDADVFYSTGYIIDDNDMVLSDYYTFYGNFYGTEMYRKLYQFNCIPILGVIMKAELVKKVGEQDEGQYITGCEDYDYWLRASINNFTFFGIDRKLFRYRLNPNGTSRNKIKMQLAEAIAKAKNFDIKRFKSEEVNFFFKPYIFPLLIKLISNNNIKEARFLLKTLSLNVPILSYKLNYWLFIPLPKISMLQVKAINKLDKIINGELRNV